MRGPRPCSSARSSSLRVDAGSRAQRLGPQCTLRWSWIGSMRAGAVTLAPTRTACARSTCGRRALPSAPSPHLLQSVTCSRAQPTTGARRGSMDAQQLTPLTPVRAAHSTPFVMATSHDFCAKPSRVRRLRADHLGTRNQWRKDSVSIKSIMSPPMPQTPRGSPLLPVKPKAPEDSRMRNAPRPRGASSPRSTRPQSASPSSLRVVGVSKSNPFSTEHPSKLRGPGLS